MRKFASSCALRLVRQVRCLAALAAMLLLSGVGAHAQQPQHAPEARIVVTGEGNVSVTPNFAQIRSGVTTRAKTVKEAEANSKLMVAIMAALKDAGIAEKDIQTSRFSIQPVYAPQEPRTEPKLLGYSVSNQVDVTIRVIGRVGDVLDKVVAAGATDVGKCVVPGLGCIEGAGRGARGRDRRCAAQGRGLCESGGGAARPG